MSLFSAPGSIVIKTTLLKSLQRHCSQHTDLALIKTSTDNRHWQIAQCSDDQISWSVYTSGKAYGNLVLQATLPGAKKLCLWLVLFLENMYSGRSNPAEEITFLEFFRSNLAEARFEIYLISYHSIRIMTV